MGRDVVRSLMTQCENITNKMMQDVSQVMERDTGSQKQPEILNSNASNGSLSGDWSGTTAHHFVSEDST
ncbi:hypothetical protein DPEC_G00094870 [Dallia pectoralis]|uniref:Uncharacterized protein n=1 Tax=Dallia pectoralis TaxID=75939 RepID=A0ACC2H240_DALPE|nr:hypothetical protein DPEC_G00094870 [Dallia pectoralis]